MTATDRSIPVLPSRSLPRTIEFYASLGFSGVLLASETYAILTCRELELHFFPHPNLDPRESYAGCYMRVADVDAWYRELAPAGVSTAGIPRLERVADKPWKMREFALVDEDGNLVKFGTPCDEPTDSQPPTDERALAELRQLEPIFHTPRSRPTLESVEAVLADGFFEVGASGRLYTRADVVDALKRRIADGVFEELQAEDVRCLRLSETSFLFTYGLVQGARVTRRSSVWQWHSQRWQIVYHQGTVVSPP